MASSPPEKKQISAFAVDVVFVFVEGVFQNNNIQRKSV